MPACSACLPACLPPLQHNPFQKKNKNSDNKYYCPAPAPVQSSSVQFRREKGERGGETGWFNLGGINRNKLRETHVLNGTGLSWAGLGLGWAGLGWPYHFILFHFISFHFISFHIIAFSFHFISFHFSFISFSFHFISF